METLLVSLPSITGAPAFCYDPALIQYGYSTIQAFQCMQTQGHTVLMIADGAWSAGFLLLWLLWLLAAIHALRGIVRAWPRRSTERSREDRRTLIVQSCRLLLLAPLVEAGMGMRTESKSQRNMG